MSISLKIQIKNLLSKRMCHPVTETEVNGGVLFDFGRAVNGCVELISLDNPIESITLCYGESDVRSYGYRVLLR